MSHLNIDKETLDTAIQAKLQELYRSTGVTPSDGFSHRVMMAAVRLEQKRSIVRTVLFSLAGLAPFALRSIWLFARGNYFSIETLPLGHLIATGYHAFLAPITAYALLAIAVSIAIYAVRTRPRINYAVRKASLA